MPQLIAKTRVLIVDDHPFFRSGIAQWLDQQAEFTCCGQAESYLTGRRAVIDSKPDVVLVDLQLGDGDGLDLTAELVEEYRQVRFVVLSQRDESVYAHRALKAGARGYIMKSEATETVLVALQTVMRGEIYLSRSVSGLLLRNLFPDPLSSKGELNHLSDRELQVFQLLGSGCSTREIAATLKLSAKTVETYREHLKEKLCLSDGEALRESALNWVEKGVLKPVAKFNGQPIRAPLG